MSQVKYKLVKCYPGSPALGTIATKEDPYYRYNGCCMVFKNIVEDYSEYWNLIKDPIFTTEDGKEMFEGDKYYAVYSTWLYDSFNVSKSSPLVHTKNFSSRELAERYIEENKPQYSKKDMLDLIKYCGYDSNELHKYLNYSDI